MRKFIATLAMACVALSSCSRQAQPQNVDENAQTEQQSQTVNNLDKNPPYEIRIKNPDDKGRVERLLQMGVKLPQDENLALFFARKFIGKPYVGHTLDQDKEEGLVVNTEQLDCTTYVENVVALTMCARRQQTRFEDFCRALVEVRYIEGEVAYTARQHYFTIWIEDNIKDGIVANIPLPSAPLSAIRTPYVDYMTTHVASYDMLNAHREWLPMIKALEQKVNKTSFSYIPKEQLARSERYKEYIHDGDIIGIVTNDKGLDISHVGFAVWHEDGLHLMHASSSQRNGKCVVDDPMPLYQYLKNQTKSVGIRVVRIKD